MMKILLIILLLFTSFKQPALAQSATIEIMSELVNLREGIDNDSGTEIDLRDVRLTKYDLINTELEFDGKLIIYVKGGVDGTFYGTVDFLDIETYDQNGNDISDFFEKKMSASISVTGTGTWSSGSYYVNYDISN